MNTGVKIESAITSSVMYSYPINNGLRMLANNFYKVWNGVELNGLQSQAYAKQVGNNHVRLEPHATSNSQKGISLSLCKLNSVTNNTVIGNNANSSNVVAGIFAAQSSTNNLWCNQVMNVLRGFEFANTNPITTWSVNVMLSARYGMYGTAWGTGFAGGIGQQGASGRPSDNFWQGAWNWPNYQTYLDVNSSAFTSPVWTRTTTGYVFISSANNGGVQSLSYFNSANTPTTTGALQSCSNSNNGNPNGNPRHWIDIAEDDIDWDDPTSEINHFVLFSTLSQDSLLMASNDTLIQFYQNNETTNLGRVTEIEHALAGGHYTEAEALIGSFSPESNIEDNFLTYYQLHLKYYVQDSLSYSDSTTLALLASQCPYSDGPAIYQARALYGLIYNLNYTYEDDDCVPEGFSMRSTNAEDSLKIADERNQLIQHERNQARKFVPSDFKLYPNPSDGVFYIKTNMTGTQTLLINNSVGALVYSAAIHAGKELITVQPNLPNGFYFVQIVEPTGKRQVKKLVLENK